MVVLIIYTNKLIVHTVDVALNQTRFLQIMETILGSRGNRFVGALLKEIS